MALESQSHSRWRMPTTVRAGFDSQIRLAQSNAPIDRRWTALERAHILSQPWPVPHVRTHAAMIGLAVRQRDTREVVGQLIRVLVAGPASAVGKYPAGNTGRARVPATRPMPIEDDLAQLLETAR
jgi:hypothetical protein